MNTELIINNIAADLPPNVTITLTRQVNDIAELKNRQAEFTNSFKLPATATNNEIFGYGNIVQSNSVNPYRKLAALLRHENQETIGYVVLQQGGKDYDCVFYSGAINFFSEIEGKKLSDIDLNAFVHEFNLLEVFNARLNDWQDCFIYPIIETAGDGVTCHKVNQIIDFNFMCPAVYMKYILNRIFADVGFECVGEFFTSERFEKLLMPFQTNKAAGVQLSTTSAFIPQPAGFPPTVFNFAGLWLLGNTNPSEWVVMPLNVEIVDISQIVALQVPGAPVTAAEQSITDGYGYPADHLAVDYPVDATIDAEVVVSTIASENGILFPIASMAEIQLVALDTSWTVTRLLKSWTFGVDYSGYGSVTLTATDLAIYAGDRIAVRCKMLNTFGQFPAPIVMGYIFTGASLKIDNVRVTSLNDDFYIIKDRWVAMQENLPDMTQKDFIKSILQRFCLTPVPIPYTNQIDLVPFEKLRENIPYAKDWSEKFSSEPAEIKYRTSEYGQTNYLRFAEDEDDVPKEYGDYSFVIDDNTLALQKNVIELKFAATYHKAVFSGQIVPYILLYEYNNPLVGKWTRKPKPRMLMLNRVLAPTTGAYQLTDPNIAGIAISDNVPLCYFEDQTLVQDLTFKSGVETDYSYIISILQKHKIITERLLLTPEDAHTHDFFVPIYSKKHTAYFQVNKIDKYTPAKATSTELIRII